MSVEWLALNWCPDQHFFVGALGVEPSPSAL